MPTLADYRHILAIECGPYVGAEEYPVRATSGSTTLKLVCSQYPVYSGISQYDLYVDRPLYRPNAQIASDKHRVVQSYDPPTGTLVPDQIWGIAPVPIATPSTYDDMGRYTYDGLGLFLYEDLEDLGATGIGEAFEILGPFDVPTLHQLINDGLKQCWLVVEVMAIPTPGASRHSLSLVAPWLQDPNHVRQAGVLASGEDRNKVDPYERIVHGTIDRDGADFYFNTQERTFAAGDTLVLRCYKRAYDHCRASGGVFGEKSGLSGETDEAPVERDWLASAALTVGWRRFGHLLEPAANQRLIRDATAAAAWFADRSRQHFAAVAPQLTFKSARRFGPVFR